MGNYNNLMTSSKISAFKMITISVLILVIISLTFMYKMSVDYVDIEVIDKERIVETTSETISSKYLIFSNKEVFENTDSFIFFKFNSSSLQGKLQKGRKYRIKVVGWRIPFLSSYRNIITAKE